MQESTVQFLVWEGPLEKGQAIHSNILGPPGGLAGKESACHVGNLGSINGVGKISPLEEWATWVPSVGLGRSPPLEEGMAAHSSILAWRIRMDRGAWRGYRAWGRRELDILSG